MTINPQRILQGRYQVVPRSIILLIKNHQVLLQLGSSDKKIFPDHFNGIGGHIERGEDILVAARRELHHRHHEARRIQRAFGVGGNTSRRKQPRNGQIPEVSEHVVSPVNGRYRATVGALHDRH